MELFAQTQQKSRLGQILLDKRLVSQEQLSKAMEQQATTGERLGDILTQWNVVTQRHIESALRAQRNLRLVASLVTAMATPFITACGGGGGETSQPTQSTSAQPTATAIAAAAPGATESGAPSTAPTVTGWVIRDSVCCAAVTASATGTTGFTASSTTTTSAVATTTTNNVTLVSLTSPTDLAAQAPAATRVTLTWFDNSGGKAKYRIYRGNTAIDEVTGSSYTDYTVNASTTYTYQVRAVDANNSNNTSGLSNVAALTTPADPNATLISGRCTAQRVS